MDHKPAEMDPRTVDIVQKTRQDGQDGSNMTKTGLGDPFHLILGAPGYEKVVI